ncbi:MAG TPA: endonuclease/exonuclease/phosphatase family protein [Caldilineaceae bacterium]|nr:endonuclease/exonuclease/phosphatase family protein [Caldilineaceae bacterium]
MAHLTLLTFNTFGIVNWDTPFRLNALAAELNRLAPDIVCLQEIHQHFFRRMIAAGALHYPAHIFEPMLYRPKGGLVTLAKGPLATTRFKLYRDQGPWYTLNIMDRMLRKGMLVTHHEHAGQEIIVINTHLIANYAADYDPNSSAARLQRGQLRQLADLVREQPDDTLVFAMGDFNIPRHSWLYEEFLERSGMEDTLSGDTRPTYRPLPGVPARYALPIDFVFVRRPAGRAFTFVSTLTFDQRIPLVAGYRGFLSDHLAIFTEVSWAEPPSPPRHHEAADSTGAP